MRWKSRFVFLLCFLLAFCAFSWAQEPPSPQATSSLEATETPPSVSQRLRAIAERLQAATNGSRDDLEILLSELELLYSELKDLQVLASGSESDLESMRALYETCSRSLTNSIKEAERLQKWNRRWKIASGALTILSAVLLLL